MMKEVILPHVIQRHISLNLQLKNIRSINSEWNKKHEIFLELVNRNSMKLVESVKIEEIKQSYSTREEE